MTPVEALYFDGRTGRSLPVTIRLYDSGDIVVAGDELVHRCTVGEVVVSSRVGDTPRWIEFADGARCETDDNDAIDRFLGRCGRGPRSRTGPRIVHLLESRWQLALSATVLTAACAWAFVAYAVPALADVAARRVPAAADARLGSTGLEILDSSFLEPSRLREKRQRRLSALFSSLAARVDDEHELRVELRHGGPLGANALALPDGTIIVTDGLVRLAQGHDELAAVIAHELGHVVHRHALRSVIQGSAVALIVTMIVGDVGSAASLAGAIPVFLVNAKYSRAFEIEADEYALTFMRQHDLPPAAFASLLRKLAAIAGAERKIDGYVSSHPPTSERIALFEAAR